MSKGELVVQVTHAASKALMKAISKEGRVDQLRTDPDDWVYLEAPEGQESPLTNWFQYDMAKIYVYVDSEEALLELDRRARERGVTTALVQEDGLTEFPGEPIYTALAWNPWRHPEPMDLSKGCPASACESLTGGMKKPLD